MGAVPSGRIEVPNLGSFDIEFSNIKAEIYGFQIHTTVAMQITGEGFSSELGQNSDAMIVRRATAAVVQTEYTEVDGAWVGNTHPVPFYSKGGTHKIHVYNGSGGAGYIQIIAITGGRYR